MNIGISFYSQREVFYLLSSPLFDLIKKDDGNNYIFFTENPAVLEDLIEEFEHIRVEKYYKSNKLRELLFKILIFPYEKYVLLNKKLIGDHEYILKEISSYNNRQILIGKFLFYFPLYPFILKLVRFITYKTKYYNEFDLDKVLLTEYHHFQEKVLSYNLGSISYLFPPSHDTYTIDGVFDNKINRYFVWDEQNKIFANKICSIPNEDITVSGNPIHESIRNFQGENIVSNKILIFGSNNFVYNEVEMVREIKEDDYLNSLGISLRISPSVGGTGKEWERRKDEHTKTLGLKNIILPSRAWFGSKYQKTDLNYDYFSSLLNHKIFIVTGVSNIAYDVLSMKGILVLMFFNDYEDADKFPWWTCEQREVLNHLKDKPGVLVCRCVKELKKQLESYIKNRDHSSTYYSQNINSSQIIFNKLLS